MGARMVINAKMYFMNLGNVKNMNLEKQKKKRSVFFIQNRKKRY